MNQKTSQIITVTVIIIIAFFGFKFFFVKPDTSDTALSAEKTASEEFVDGQVIVAYLDKIQAITLDEKIFTNPVFLSLISFERPIQDQVLSRVNPFLPVGR